MNIQEKTNYELMEQLAVEAQQFFQENDIECDAYTSLDHIKLDENGKPSSVYKAVLRVQIRHKAVRKSLTINCNTPNEIKKSKWRVRDNAYALPNILKWLKMSHRSYLKYSS